jgi:hypothetical protein
MLSPAFINFYLIIEEHQASLQRHVSRYDEQFPDPAARGMHPVAKSLFTNGE